jgi:hypothetical protein
MGLRCRGGTGTSESDVQITPSQTLILKWQLSSMAQVGSSFFPQALIHTVERLYILENEVWRSIWQDDIENDQWLELLHPLPM